MKYECPHCGRELYNKSHITRCPQNPTVFAATLAMMSDAERPGHAIGLRTYQVAWQANGGTLAASASTLQVHFETWAAAVRAHGLIPGASGGAHPKGGKTQCVGISVGERQRSTCNHCGRDYAMLHHHEPYCIERPGVRDALRVFAAEHDDPGMICNEIAYAARLLQWRATRTEQGALYPGTRSIYRHFGTWAEFAAWLGLDTWEDSIDEKTLAWDAQYKAKRAQERALEAAEWDRNGIPVLRAEPVPARGGGWAWTVR